MGGSTTIARINALPGQLVNQIAAGEVIERPSSVVKELVENAIDSGADRIDIELEGGGIEKITVRDNGCGIHPEDMELAVKRHSTSKIRTQSDLQAISSLGFRGEALSSIASVSDFSLTSRLASMDQGKCLSSDPYTSKFDISPAAHPSGTTVIVSKLFQSIPARRKFLRSQRTELLHIQETVKRFILSRLDIAFYFYHNGRKLLACPAIKDDQPESRLNTIMGSQFLPDSWYIDSKADGMHLWGWLGNEMTARSHSDRQYLYLNQRIIRDKHINHAVRQALQGIIADSRYPSYTLYLEIDPATVDVNVHPAKQEVRFKQTRNIHDFIYAALKETINQGLLGKDMVKSSYNSTGNVNGKINFPRDTGSFDLAELKAIYVANTEPGVINASSQDLMGRPLAVVHGHYLITLYEKGLRIINMKAMMQNYIYSSMSRDYEQLQVRSRPLLVPLMLKLKEQEILKLIEHEELLQSMGIEMQQSGPTTLSIRNIPASLPGLDIMALLREFSNIINKDNAKPQSSLLTLIAELGSELVTGMNLKDTVEQLQKMSRMDLPFDQDYYPGLWKTMTRSNLHDLLDGRQTPN